MDMDKHRSTSLIASSHRSVQNGGAEQWRWWRWLGMGHLNDNDNAASSNLFEIEVLCQWHHALHVLDCVLSCQRYRRKWQLVLLPWRSEEEWGRGVDSDDDRVLWAEQGKRGVERRCYEESVDGAGEMQQQQRRSGGEKFIVERVTSTLKTFLFFSFFSLISFNINDLGFY